jgi:hypothetical protein
LPRGRPLPEAPPGNADLLIGSSVPSMPAMAVPQVRARSGLRSAAGQQACALGRGCERRPAGYALPQALTQAASKARGNHRHVTGHSRRPDHCPGDP